VDVSRTRRGAEEAYEAVPGDEGGRALRRLPAVVDEHLDQRLGYFGAIAGILSGLLLATAIGLISTWCGGLAALLLSTGVALTGWWAAPLFASVTRARRFIVWLVMLGLLVYLAAFAPSAYTKWILFTLAAFGVLFTSLILGWALLNVRRVKHATIAPGTPRTR
jgi:hypothetical protein